MTRVILIHAGPTPWDLEERISGNTSLPLTDEARAKIGLLLETLPQIDGIYCSAANEATEQAAKMVAGLNRIKPRDNPDLATWNLGLWQGLRLEDLRQRYRSVLQQWETAPATVVPPEGESFVDAIARLDKATQKILRRNRGRTIALILRPSALQIVLGILKSETPEQIAAHLQTEAAMETIELED